MARKYDLISELYNRTCKTVVANPQNWQAFLESACRNYKLRYDEQLLVYAQRPDATAVLEIERWNGSFGGGSIVVQEVLQYLQTKTVKDKGSFTTSIFQIRTRADTLAPFPFGKCVRNTKQILSKRLKALSEK